MPFELDEMMEQKQRRERIATACMQGLLDNPYRDEGKANDYAELAVFFADALITELDKPRACSKLCVGCNRVLPVDQFSKASPGRPTRDGRVYKCNQCVKG